MAMKPPGEKPDHDLIHVFLGEIKNLLKKGSGDGGGHL